MTAWNQRFFSLLSFCGALTLLVSPVASAQYQKQYQNQYQNQFQNPYNNPSGGHPRPGPPGGALPETVPPSASTLRIQRWTEEWKQQHPGEPVPNLGILEKMHSGETQALIRAGGQQMWANRQAELRRNYAMAKQMQEQKNAAAGVRWNAQQWSAWDGEYNAGQKAQADAYLEAVRMSGQMARDEEVYRRTGFWPTH